MMGQYTAEGCTIEKKNFIQIKRLFKNKINNTSNWDELQVNVANKRLKFANEKR